MEDAEWELGDTLMDKDAWLQGAQVMHEDKKDVETAVLEQPQKRSNKCTRAALRMLGAPKIVQRCLEQCLHVVNSYYALSYASCVLLKP
eukprot:5507290-Alexandrium_andersonii.AAC.1